MKNWVRVGKGDFFNLDNIAHIWIEHTVNGFYAMGEMMHNQEEVVLSDPFESFQECQIYLLNNL